VHEARARNRLARVHNTSGRDCCRIEVAEKEKWANEAQTKKAPRMTVNIDQLMPRVRCVAELPDTVDVGAVEAVDSAAA
jgi:hypothetical protein